MNRRPPIRRSTPQGEHRPVLLEEVLAVLAPQPGDVAVDCTLGWAGHAVELLRRVGPTGRLIGIDFDADHLPQARQRLEETGHPLALALGLHHGNFAGLANLLGAEGLTDCDVLLADLGMSSLQLDDPGRGFSYVRDGPLDMRMDRTRGRSAAQVLQTIRQEELAEALRVFGDEPDADRIAAGIIAARELAPFTTTTALAKVVAECAAGDKPKRPGGFIRPSTNGPSIPRPGPFKPCAFWSTASWPISKHCCGSCPPPCGLAAWRPSSAFTAAKTGLSRPPSVPAGITRPIVPVLTTLCVHPGKNGRPIPVRARPSCAG